MKRYIRSASNREEYTLADIPELEHTDFVAVNTSSYNRVPARSNKLLNDTIQVLTDMYDSGQDILELDSFVGYDPTSERLSTQVWRGLNDEINRYLKQDLSSFGLKLIDLDQHIKQLQIYNGLVRTFRNSIMTARKNKLSKC